MDVETHFVTSCSCFCILQCAAVVNEYFTECSEVNASGGVGGGTEDLVMRMVFLGGVVADLGEERDLGGGKGKREKEKGKREKDGKGKREKGKGMMNFEVRRGVEYITRNFEHRTRNVE